MVSTLVPMREIKPDGTLLWHFHAGQRAAWHATQRFVLVLAGTQSGKTSFAPPWLWREIQTKGPGDYLIGTPTYTLLELKALPEFKWLFEQTLRLGTYVGSPIRKFTFSEEGARRTFGYVPEIPTVVYFGHAQDPDSLESATYKGAWLDEAGQKKFRRASWEAIQRRLSIYQGRVLLTTTPYDLGWLKTELVGPWTAAGGNHPRIAVVNFRSLDNPAFPRAEWDEQAASLPKWKFNMFYAGRFERPAGLIFDVFDEARHVVPTFPIPTDWPRYHGSDFGGVNTAAIFLAEERDADGKATGRMIAYREYLAGGLTAAEHAASWRKGEPRLPKAIGGSKSEGQWRKEFSSAGFPIAEPPVSEVEVGIDRLYAGIKQDKLIVMEHLTILREMLRTYSRELDDRGEPTEKIEDKETFHVLDACRYIGAWLFRPPARGGLA
jgi:hypothetical protein